MEERQIHHTIKGRRVECWLGRGVGGGGLVLNTPVTLRMDGRLFLKAVQGRHIRKAAYLSL